MFGHFSSHTWNVISVLEWRPDWPQRFMKDKYVRWQRPYAVWKVWPHNKVHARYAPLASCPTTGDLPSESLWHTKQFTARHQNILSNCANRLQVFDSRRRLRSASTGDLLVPRTTTSFADQAFACAGLRAWNNLPPELRRIKRNDTFKKHLKTNLFKQSNGQWPSVPFRQCPLFCYISYAFVIIRWIALDPVALYTVISKLTSSIDMNSRAKIHSVQIFIGHLWGHLGKHAPVVIISRS